MRDVRSWKKPGRLFLACVVSAMTAGAAASAQTPARQADASQRGVTGIRGVVVEARTGVPLERAQVWLRDTNHTTQTDRDGRFELLGVDAGWQVLHISAVGYVLARRPVEVVPGQIVEVAIHVTGGSGTYDETVNVVAPRGGEVTPAPVQQMLEGVELQRLSGGMLEDPTRAVQALPGVAASDDMRAQFSVRGSAPRNIGVTFEGVTTGVLVHTWHREDDGSASMVNTAVVDRMTLLPGSYAQRVGGRTGSWLDVTMREGPRDHVETRASAGLTSSSVVAGGPLGASRRGSYLVAGRVNYIDKMLGLMGATGDTAGFSMADIQGKMVYDLAGRHQAQVAWLGGLTWLNLENERGGAEPNSDLSTVNATGLLTGVLRSTIGSRLVLTNRVSTVANRYRTEGFFLRDLARSTRVELSYRGDLIASVSGSSTIEAGASVQRNSQTFEATEYAWANAQHTAVETVQRNELDAGTYHYGGYAWLRWNRWPSVTLGPGVRVDRASLTRQAVVSPWFQVAWKPTPRSEVALGAAVNHQFPEFGEVFGLAGGGRGLRAERAIHTDLTLSRALRDHMRVQVAFYNRAEREGLRFRDGEIRKYPWGIHWPGRASAGYANALDGYSRGIEVELRAGSPNGLSGWVSYALSYTRFQDAGRSERFWGDYDQRHTLNVFAQYRRSARWSASARFRYGSNYPLVGYYERRIEPVYDGATFLWNQTTYVVSDVRNAERVPAYARLDGRWDRTFAFKRRRLTVYVEATNALNRENRRQEYHGCWPGWDGRVVFNKPLHSLFPLVPSVGFLIDF